MPSQEYYTIEEVADLFRVSGQTVRMWIKAEKIKAIRLGGIFRIPAAEVARVQANGI